MEMAATAEQMDAVIKGLDAIRKDMSDFRQEIKRDLATMKIEFKKELDDQIQGVSREIKAQGVLIDEVQNRVSEIEDWRTEMSEVVVEHEERVKALQDKVLDLTTRSMRNNIRVFSVPESATEGKSVTTFLEELIWASLDLPDGTELNIMRAHRALAPKPKDSTAPPRSIVANFLRFDIKEMVLRKAWDTEVKVDGRRVGFDHDYPPEVVKLRKDYIPLKKILKQEGIGFSSPFTKLRVQWPEGTKTYMNAGEAAREIHAKGLKYKERVSGRTRSLDSPTRDEATAASEPGGEAAAAASESGGETAGGGEKVRQKGLVEAWSQLMKRTPGQRRGAARTAKKKAETQKVV